MRRLFGALLCVVLAACSLSGRSPERTVSLFLDALKTGEFDTANAFITGGGDDPLGLSGVESEYRDILKKLSYEGLAAEVSGDAATVSFTLETADFDAVMEAVTDEAFEYFYAGGVTEEELLLMVETAIYEKMTGDAAPMKRTDVVMRLFKVGGEWKIRAEAGWLDAVTGGLPAFAAQT
jgi:hypothetical protein